MTTASPTSGARHGLAFLTLLSFIASFLAARAFTAISPDTVVVAGGIHFHHFWYGLILVVVAGWLAIVTDRPDLDRVFAIVFGLGAGLIGDEVGLLLTLGDYQSELTYVFFVGILSLAGLSYLVLRYREQLTKDVLSLGTGERLIQFGIFSAGMSSVAWAFGQVALASGVLAFGLVLTVVGLAAHRKNIYWP
jgi:hypothetical protein